MPVPVRIAIFDFDGTLVDSQHAIHACMESAFAGIGLAAPTLAQTHRVIGLPLELAPPSETDRTFAARLLAIFRDIVSRVIGCLEAARP